MLATVLAFVTTALAVKPRPESYTCKDCGMTSHHPQDVENQYCGNCQKFEEIRRLERELDDARTESARWQRLTEHWRARFEGSPAGQTERQRTEEMARYLRAQQNALAQQSQQLASAQQAQALANQHYAYHGLLSAERPFNESFEAICNCVPARHDMFLPR